MALARTDIGGRDDGREMGRERVEGGSLKGARLD